jgi:hypothetical protein
MRFTSLGVVACVAWAAASAPAQAAWKSYISHPLGFSFEAPGEVKTAKGTYEAPVAGKRSTYVFSSTEDDIEYRVTVVDTTAVANKSATLLGEATYRFQDGKKLLMDAFGRVDRQFGRKLTIDLPNNGGRATAAYYFINGRLIELRATAKPGSDYETPDMGRFIDSIAFFTVRAHPDATELNLPK